MNSRFASGLIKTIGSFGPSEMIVQKNFYNAVARILDSIEVSNEKEEVSRSDSAHSVEVKKSGTVILAKYDFKFNGIVEKGCCYDSQDVDMKLDVKVWSFATLMKGILSICCRYKLVVPYLDVCLKKPKTELR